MQMNIHQAKAKLSALIERVEAGDEVILARRNVPVARIVPNHKTVTSRIGGLRGHPYQFGDGFDDPVANAEITAAFQQSQ